MAVQKTISPIDGSVFVERALAEGPLIGEALDRAVAAQRAWRVVPVEQRAAICRKFCDAFEAKKDAIAVDLTWQMGRPIRYSPNEVRGTLERARYMIDVAAEALADVDAGPKTDFRRFVRREPRPNGARSCC